MNARADAGFPTTEAWRPGPARPKASSVENGGRIFHDSRLDDYEQQAAAEQSRSAGGRRPL